MDDIFTMQEEVAKNVAEGLQVIITKEEEKKIEKKPTENTEAYELWLKAKTYYDRTTKVDFERSLSLNETAVSLDPKFISAHVNIANTALEYHRIYSRDRTLLEKAERHIAEVIALEGESARVNYLRSRLFAERGDLETSLRYAVVATELDPEFGAGFDSLGSTYQALGNMVEAARAWKLHADLRDSDPQAHFNYLIMLHEIGDDERLNEEVARARPVFERHIRLTPDDVTARVNYLHVLLFAGYTTEAIVGAQEIEQIESIDGIALYNLCCFYLRVGEGHRAFPLLRSAIERGYSNIQTLRRDPDIDPLRGTPEFETLMKELEEKIAQEKHG
jgi:tetratricopeptide (TPR) repeat protein